MNLGQLLSTSDARITSLQDLVATQYEGFGGSRKYYTTPKQALQAAYDKYSGKRPRNDWVAHELDVYENESHIIRRYRDPHILMSHHFEDQEPLSEVFDYDYFSSQWRGGNTNSLVNLNGLMKAYLEHPEIHDNVTVHFKDWTQLPEGVKYLAEIYSKDFIKPSWRLEHQHQVERMKRRMQERGDRKDVEHVGTGAAPADVMDEKS